MNCPKCSNRMNEIKDFSFSASKCTGCSGIWFRDSDHEIAKTMKGAESLDDNNAKVATNYNLKRDINCPECNNVAMLKMVDQTQLSIEFESCPDCYGVFFDAGEFSDFSEFTFLERVTRAFDAFKTNIRD